MSDIKAALSAFALQLPAGVRVLDVGCGLRPYESLFAHGTYIGIDVPVSGRDASGKRADYEFDGVNIPLPDASFDVVICTEVLEHATKPDELLAEVARVTKSHGQLFLTVPFMWGLHELPYDFRRYTTEGIARAVTNAGFSINRCEKLTPGLGAVRLLVASETNYYLNHVASDTVKRSLNFRFWLWVQDILFRVLTKIWKHTIRFERIYIDNLVVARKDN